MPKKTTDPVELLTEQIKARLNALIHTEDTTSLQAVVNGLDLLLEDQKQNKSKLDGVLEGYKPVRLGRMFYPRNFQLSEDFINSFHREYDRLVGEGQNARSLVERFGKAMKFHVNDSRKYRQLDEKHKEDHRGHGHDCKEVHPDIEHDEWKRSKGKKINMTGSGLPKDNPAPEGSGIVVKPFGTKKRD